MEENILKNIDSISKKINLVFNYINKPRYQNNLISDKNNWNQICSSLRAIEDTFNAIQSYLKNEFPKDTGTKYIYTYGIMQALFIQQDALNNLFASFDLRKNESELFKKIRELRNISIGHPTKQGSGEKVSYGFISQSSLSKEKFLLAKTNTNDEDSHIKIKLIELINGQTNEIGKFFDTLNNELIIKDKEHRIKFKNKKVADIFHDELRYPFEKISNGIYSFEEKNKDIYFDDNNKIEFAKTCLDSVIETYEEFRKELEQRNEYNEDIQIEWDLNNHALENLKNYFDDKDKNIKEQDAIINYYYACEKVKEFVEIAKYIDEDYEKEFL